MTRDGRPALGTAVLVLLATTLARAADPAPVVPDPHAEMPAAPCCAWDASPAAAGSPLSVLVADLTPGLEFSAGLLVLRPGADNLGYATTTTFLPIPNPQWAVQALEPGYQAGFCVGARYTFPCSGNDIQLNWEHLRTSDSAFVPVSNLTTQWISPFSQTGPSTSELPNMVGLFHLKAARGQVDFDHDMVNLDVGQAVSIGPNTQLRLFAGLSYARLREQLVSTFYNDPNIEPVPPVVAPGVPGLKSITLNNTSTYSGLGPRLGFASAFNLPWGFRLLGQLSGAVLAGRTQPAQYSFSAVLSNEINHEQISSGSVAQVVCAGDAKLGLGYSCEFANGGVLSCECGFKAALFIDPFSTYETSTNVLSLDIGSLSTNSMRHTPSNFTLNGLYATCGWQW